MFSLNEKCVVHGFRCVCVCVSGLFVCVRAFDWDWVPNGEWWKRKEHRTMSVVIWWHFVVFAGTRFWRCCWDCSWLKKIKHSLEIWLKIKKFLSVRKFVHFFFLSFSIPFYSAWSWSNLSEISSNNSFVLALYGELLALTGESNIEWVI